MAEKWLKTQFPGVRYRESTTKKHSGRPDRYFTIRYKISGVLKEESLGWASDGWNAQKASLMRSELIKNQKVGEGPSTLNEKRQLARDKKDSDIAEKEKAAKETVTFGQYFTAIYCPGNQNAKAPKSQAREKSLYNHWIKSVIGEYSFNSITHQHLEMIKQSMMGSDLSPRSVRYALAVIRQVFNHARFTKVYEGLSPVSNVKFPQADNKRLRFLTTEEASMLLKELKERSLQLYEIALVSLRTGARADEIFSLKWGDLDFNKETMTLWDTKNTKTRLARMTPDIRQMFLEKRSPDFSPEEFQVRQSAKHLYDAVKQDIPGFLSEIEDPILWLNELLKVVKLHEIFIKTQIEINLSEDTTALIKTVKAFGNKAYEQMKDSEKDDLKRLNRLFIEETYPLLTPKSPEKTTRSNARVVFPDRNDKKIVDVSRSFERAVEKIGFNKDISDPRMKVVFHTLRHTFASWLVEKGVDLYVVKQLMGHSSLAMTERYSHVGENALTSAIRKLGKIDLDRNQVPKEIE